MEGQRKVGAECGLLTIVLAVGLLVRSPDVLLVAVVIAVHTLVGNLQSLAFRTPDLQARRRLSSSRIYEGDEVEVELSLENGGGDLGVVFVREEVGLDGPDGATRWAGRLPREGSAACSYTARPRRGFYPLDGVWVEGRDILGFVSWAQWIACASPLWVLPRYERLARVALAPRRTLTAPGMIRSRQGGPGIQFFASRPYIPGDDVRRINWKALARRGSLVVNLYEAERAADVVVVLDIRKVIYERWDVSALFDHAVRACAAICDALNREGHRTSLLLYGELLDWVPPSCGRAHRERLLQTLARARLGFSVAFSDLRALPVPLFPSGCSVIVVSPFDPSDGEALGALQAWGHDVLVLVPDPVPALNKAILGADTARVLAARLIAIERDLMLRVLTSTGVRLAVWDVTEPLAPVVSTVWRTSA